MPDPSPYATAADRPLRGRDEPEPQPLPEAETAGEVGWRQFLKGLSGDVEFLLLAGALMALSGWFILESGRERSHTEAVPHGLVAPPGPAEEVRRTFAFVDLEARDRLLPALPATVGRSSDALPRPLATASVDQHALIAEPQFDSLGSLQISGLPTDATLSAGATLAGAEGEWAVAFGDLDKLVIELPRVRSTPIRAMLDLRNRAGVKITSLTVEVRERADEGTDTSPVAEPAAVKSKVRPAKAVRPGSKNLRKTARPPTAATAATAAKPLPVFPGDPPRPIKPQKAAVSAPVAPAPPAIGLFQPDPKDSSVSGLSASSREDPRFMTLRGLGMPPPDLGPVPSAPATP